MNYLYSSAADAVHLSPALWLQQTVKEKVTFVASDEDLLRAARSEKLKILYPIKNEAVDPAEPRPSRSPWPSLPATPLWMDREYLRKSLRNDEGGRTTSGVIPLGSRINRYPLFITQVLTAA